MSSGAKKIRIACVGDTSDCTIENPFLPENISEMIKRCDALIWNCEAPIVEDEKHRAFSLKKVALDSFAAIFGRKQPTVLSSEKIAEIMNLTENNIATLAANHAIDAGTGQIEITRKILKKHGHHSLGAGIDKKEALLPLEISVNNVKIAIVNYNYIGWNAPMVGYADVYGAGKIRAGAAPLNFTEAEEKIRTLRENNDLVIACLHLGRCCEENLPERDMKIVKSFLDWGTNLVLVHHSHTMGGVLAQDQGKIAVLGLGDFIFNCSPCPDYNTFYFCMIEWDSESGFTLKGCPVIRNDGIPVIADIQRSKEISHRVRAMSEIAECMDFRVDNEGKWRVNGRK